MQFANLTAAYLAFLAMVIIFFYLIKGNKKEIELPAILLWDKINYEKINTRSRWRLDPEPLMFLQLFILGLFVLALMKPYIVSPVPVVENAVIIIDKSASMQAEDVEPDRFNQAINQAINRVNIFPAGTRIAVVGARGNPYLVADFSDDHEQLVNKLRQLVVTDTEINVTASLQLAQSLVTNQPGNQIIFFTDGCFPEPEIELFEILEVVNIGFPVENIAIVDLDIRSRTGTRNDYDLLLKVANFARQPNNVPLVIKSPQTVYINDTLNLAAGAEKIKIYSIRIEDRVPLKVELKVTDPLAIDNTAYTVAGPSESLVLLLVGENNYFLERALLSLPGVRLFVIDDLSNEFEFEFYDLIIFNHSQSPPDFEGTAVYFGSVPPDLKNSVSENNYQDTKINEEVLITGWQKNHPLFRFVDFNNLRINEYAELTPPLAASVLMSAHRGPLIFADNERLITTFSLEKSNFVLQTTFPVFLHNILAWYYPGFLDCGYSQINVSDNYEIVVSSGQLPVNIEQPDGSSKIITDNYLRHINQQGNYQLQFADNSRDYLAVNLFSRTESNLSKTGFTVEKKSEETKITAERINPYWYYFAILIFILLLLEWFIYIYHRGGESR